MAFARVGLNRSFIGVILAHTALASPIVVITVLATLSRLVPTLLRAASSLGAGLIFAFRKVTLPPIMSGVAGGLSFAFALSFDDVVVALFVAGLKQRTLPIEMYLAKNDLVYLTITAAATVLLALAIVFMLTIEILKRRDPPSNDHTPS